MQKTLAFVLEGLPGEKHTKAGCYVMLQAKTAGSYIDSGTWSRHVSCGATFHMSVVVRWLMRGNDLEKRVRECPRCGKYPGRPNVSASNKWYVTGVIQCTPLDTGDESEYTNSNPDFA